jgi:hypothetical protein
MVNLMETLDGVIAGPTKAETFSGWVKCDTCDARSLWQVKGAEGKPLFLCGHHKNKLSTKPKFTDWAKEFIELEASVSRT